MVAMEKYSYVHKQVPTVITARQAKRLRALKHTAEEWHLLGHGGFFWTARKTSSGPTGFSVPCDAQTGPP